MPTNLLDIQAREVHFRTQTNADWLDGLEIWKAGAGGIIAGANNRGNGALIINSVAPQAVIGQYIVEVTSLDGVPRITVQRAGGTVIAQGVVGLPLYAGGITLTLTQGTTLFGVDDTFAISLLPVPIDITGIEFTLQVRKNVLAASIALEARSNPGVGRTATIATGGAGGQIAMRVLRDAMQRDKFSPGAYVYDILARDPGVELIVPVFFGTLQHVDGVSQLP